MKEFNPSATAAMTAAIRAVHFKYYQGAKLYSDPFGEIFTNSFYRLMIRSPLIYKWARSTYYKRLLTSEGWIVGRARFVQDELIEFIKTNKNHQVVILGAGYDSFALKPELCSLCNIIFEVDHPATMKRKRNIIGRNQIENNIYFVSVNFENQKLFERLIAAGFNPECPTFFAWTGNIFYLTKPAVKATLTEIYQQTKSEVYLAFDYMDPLVLAAEASVTLQEMRAYVDRWCEPWINAYTDTEMVQLLHEIGFKVRKSYNELQQNEYYFNSFKGLQATEGFRWMLASK
jgi:methyltransferase (TIGR00027 family)